MFRAARSFLSARRSGQQPDLRLGAFVERLHAPTAALHRHRRQVGRTAIEPYLSIKRPGACRRPPRSERWTSNGSTPRTRELSPEPLSHLDGIQSVRLRDVAGVEDIAADALRRERQIRTWGCLGSSSASNCRHEFGIPREKRPRGDPKTPFVISLLSKLQGAARWAEHAPRRVRLPLVPGDEGGRCYGERVVRERTAQETATSEHTGLLPHLVHGRPDRRCEDTVNGAGGDRGVSGPPLHEGR